jgi:hypothetical protein
MKKNNSGISILLTILILSSMMILTLAISEIVLRVGKSSREIGFSEIAYYAAETATEKAFYEIEKNRTIADLDSLSGNLDELSDASWSLAVSQINSTDPYQFDLGGGEFFLLEIDFENLIYPNTLNVSWTGSNVKLITLTTDGVQNVYTSSGVALSNLNTNLYKLTLINSGGGDSTITLDPNGGDLPIGIELTATGNYKNSERIINIERDNLKVY